MNLTLDHEYLHDQMLSSAFSIPLAPRERTRRGEQGHLFVGSVFCEWVLKSREKHQACYASVWKKKLVGSQK